MNKIPALACGLVLALAPLALAQDADFVKSKLGDAYAEASPVDKIVMISVGKADKLFKDYKEVKRAQSELDAVVLAEIQKEEGSAKRLARLGALRKEATDKVKELTAERRKEKKPYVSMMEPDREMQAALAMSYVLDTAGPKPTLEALSCLKTVREATSWGAHNSVILAYAMDAISRDEAYAKADHVGKLDIIRKLAQDQGALSDQERKYLDQAVLSDWISAEIKAGKSPGDLVLAVEELKKSGKICWFASTWAAGFIKALARVR